MRKTLNDNPVVQAVIVGALAIVAGFLLLTRVMGGSDTDATATPTTPTTEATAPTSAAAPAPADTAAPAPTPQATEPPVSSPSAKEAFVPGPGLPKPVVVAYAKGETVVVLVTKHAGLDDAEIRSVTRGFSSIQGVTMFTTNVHHVSRYSRITAGVDLDRAPALVVLSPRDVSDDGLPVATVSYGFRSIESARQQIEDARYKGPELPYYPKSK